MNETILQMENIEKSFFGVHALKSVDFNLRAGEVHALMGENGAGKSTLMKILTGIYKADSGKIICFNKPCEFSSVKESLREGISIIHQELNQVGALSVAQNIFLGREPVRFKLFIDDRKIERESEKMLQLVGVKVSPREKMNELTVGKQQMVEIAKALSFNSKILVLDEPTTALTEKEVEELFRIMNSLKAKGIGMIYISHRMEEIERIADRVTIMRDGENVGTFEMGAITKDDIIKKMVGRELSLIPQNKNNEDIKKDVALEVQDLNSKNKLKNVSFTLYKGEVLGFSGLMGAGRTSLARAICGAEKFSSGNIYIKGEKVIIRSPADAVKKGVCYLSEDRKRYGLLLDKSVKDNTILAALEKFVEFGFINDKKAAVEAKNKNEFLKTKTPSVLTVVKNLSGGNQQKVILARWLLRNADIFILDEPTKGIDIGAKGEMYELIKKLAAEGKAIILISSELAEIERCADRVVVMCEGRITKILSKQEANHEIIMKYSMMRESENYECH